MSAFWSRILISAAGIPLVLWLFAARRLRELGAGFWLLVVGTACGVASQVAEAVEYGPGDKRVAAFDELMVFEELLEMVEALLIGLALLAALQVLYRRARA